jgi:cell division protein FtsB
MSILEENLLTNSQEASSTTVNKSHWSKGIITRLFVLAVLTVLLALHMSELFMGKNSVAVYYDLKDKKIDLKDEIIRLKNENAKLQKELFELKSLEPDELIENNLKKSD